MMNSSDPAPSTPFQPVANHYYKIMRQYQVLLDRVTPFVLYRWLGTAGILGIFMLRIVLAQGVSLSNPFIMHGCLCFFVDDSGISVSFRPVSSHTLSNFNPPWMLIAVCCKLPNTLLYGLF